MNLTSQFQCCNNIVIMTFEVQRELNLFSNVETKLEQRSSFDIVASTSLLSCVLVALRCHLYTGVDLCGL